MTYAPSRGLANQANKKVYIDHPEKPVKAHQFNGYYFTYPSEERHRGLVSTISDDPPMLNWIFVDGSTGVLRHGKRSDTLSEGVVVGPWGWSEDERDLALKGRSDLFVAVQELEEDGGRWYVYFDATGTGVFPDDAGLLPRVRRKMRVVLRRKMALGMESRYIKNDGS